ncbi:WhiB family transcriptional regulator [Kitasatospora sp. NPDC052896]|uniref:WhiB family transcriptional regulator n=1 Tax=Kitasatospora sp. NPDC052896 TaxID=3364061 RepID=UPI0037C9DDBE
MSDVSRLPGPLEQHWNWQLDAACRGADSSLFFHPPGERNPAHDDRDTAAKAVCARCPVREACLNHALTAREPYGVWGGLSEDERAAVLRSRRRGHPARHRVAV